MESVGGFTRHEILTQPEAWSAALKALQEQAEAIGNFCHSGQYEQVLFTGCGSTYYLALSAAASLQEIAGVPAKGLPASEIWLYPHSAYLSNRRSLLVAVSRSGETTETLRAVDAFHKRGDGDVLTLSCYPESQLPTLGELNLVFASGQENSIAQTRAFTTLYLASLYLAALWAGRKDLVEQYQRLPEAARRMIFSYQDTVRELGSDAGLDRFYFLGSGTRYGLACELSLKMKEMSLSQSEPFHFMEFRHGPKSMISKNALVVGLVSQENRREERAVLQEMHALGGQIMAIEENESEADELSVTFRSGLSDSALGPLYLPIGQLLAFERAQFGGLNPDQPNNLDAVVKL